MLKIDFWKCFDGSKNLAALIAERTNQTSKLEVDPPMKMNHSEEKWVKSVSQVGNVNIIESNQCAISDKSDELDDDLWVKPNFGPNLDVKGPNYWAKFLSQHKNIAISS